MLRPERAAADHAMHDKFTERVRKVIYLAREEAARLQHDYIGTEHLLLGLLHDGRARDVLVARGVGLDGTRALVGELVRKHQAG